MLFFADGMAGAEGQLALLLLAVVFVPNLFISWLWNLHFQTPCGSVVVSAMLGSVATGAVFGLLWDLPVPPFTFACVAACAVPPIVLPLLKRMRASATPTEPSA